MSIVQLDYKPAKLTIECTNGVEEAYRRTAASKEPWTISFIEEIPAGAILWDIGANTGPYSLIAAHRNLTTIAIEPGANNYAALCRNLALNNLLDRCLTLCLALGEKSCIAWLDYQDMRQGAAHHIVGGTRKKWFHRQLIPVWSWDELATRLPLPADRLQFAKIDVDGGELKVLQGAPQMLQRLSQIMIEMQLPDEKAITGLLTAAGYRLVQRWDERNGTHIPDMAYGRFARG